MEEPPFLIDGTRVVEYAPVDASRLAGKHVSVVVSGVALGDNLRGVAIAEDLVKDGVFALHCNDRWETVAAERFLEPEAARAAVERAYGMALPWQPYRSLTAKEQSEVDTTRAFLREIAAEFPEQ